MRTAGAGKPSRVYCLSGWSALGSGRVAVTLNGERRSGPAGSGQVLGGEVHVAGTEILLQTSNLRGTRYGHDPMTLGKQPQASATCAEVAPFASPIDLSRSTTI